MTIDPNEPKSVEELVARYRDVRRRLYPAPQRPAAAEGAKADFAIALSAAVTADHASESGRQAKHAQEVVCPAGGALREGGPSTESVPTVLAERHQQSVAALHPNSPEPVPVGGGDVSPGAPRRSARAALQAVSERTSVPVAAILGRERRSDIAAARHEAIWRVREATKWSLPRVGQFFDGRDHTTVLHSLRRMDDRAAEDPEVRAYMDGIRQVYAAQRAAHH
jgi:hypothetical protein